jgi:hypothetical protein
MQRKRDRQREHGKKIVEDRKTKRKFKEREEKNEGLQTDKEQILFASYRTRKFVILFTIARNWTLS